MKKRLFIFTFFVFIGVVTPLFSITEEQLRPYTTLEELVATAHRCVEKTIGGLFDYTGERKSMVERAIVDGQITGQVVKSYDADDAAGAFKDWIRDNLLRVKPAIRSDASDREDVDDLEVDLVNAQNKVTEYQNKLNKGKKGSSEARRYMKKLTKYRREVERLKRELDAVDEE